LKVPAVDVLVPTSHNLPGGHEKAISCRSRVLVWDCAFCKHHQELPTSSFSLQDMGFSSLTSLPNQARVVVVGSGRMGQIRSSIIYANPRFELSGIVDVSIEAATKLAEKYRVRKMLASRSILTF